MIIHQSQNFAVSPKFGRSLQLHFQSSTNALWCLEKWECPFGAGYKSLTQSWSLFQTLCCQRSFKQYFFLILPCILFYFLSHGSYGLFQLTFVSNNYTAAPVEHFKIILFSAIKFLFRGFLLSLPCMVTLILHSYTPQTLVGLGIYLIFILKSFLSALCLLGLTSCH